MATGEHRCPARWAWLRGEHLPQVFRIFPPCSTLVADGPVAPADHPIPHEGAGAGDALRRPAGAATIVAGYGVGWFMTVGLLLRRVAPAWSGADVGRSTQDAAHSSVVTPTFRSITFWLLQGYQLANSSSSGGASCPPITGRLPVELAAILIDSQSYISASIDLPAGRAPVVALGASRRLTARVL